MRSALLMLLLGSASYADGPADNKLENVRPVPPQGSAISDADRKDLTEGAAALAKAIEPFAKHELYPDLAIFHKAVDWALKYDEIFIDKGRDDVKTLKNLLMLGQARVAALKAGKTPWLGSPGLVVRGYRSKIDDSIQPYGLVIPKELDFSKPCRLDVWWHGRGETLTEANFLEQRLKSPGEFAPTNAIVLHPYGRFCNANKFAGEVDTFEAIDHLKKHYKIDEKKIVARGFSMGGAACWQFATHYPSYWAAANPGAGFAETPEFLNNFQNETVKPTWYEEHLWRLTNATDYAQNLLNLPTIAYSGEIDKQKQAADVMAREAQKVGATFEHIIGPKTAHKYEADAKRIVAQKLDAILEPPQNLLGPRRAGTPIDKEQSMFKYATYTTRYDTFGPFRITGLEKHWQRATIEVVFDSDGVIRNRGPVFAIKTQGVTHFHLLGGVPTQGATLDGQHVDLMKHVAGEKAVDFRRVDGKWEIYDAAKDDSLRKRPGLQGPVDDAFMDRFIFVKPTGQARNVKVAEWIEKEMNRAIREWRRVYRGDAIVKNDTDISEDDIRSANLILWGDAESNKILGRTIRDLPFKWEKGITFGGTTYDGQFLVPIMIYPNPLNPKKYVVLNSGFTFREYDALNNARQVAKLPDYALVDIVDPPTSRSPGKVVRAGFFDEKWQVQKDDGK